MNTFGELASGIELLKPYANSQAECTPGWGEELWVELLAPLPPEVKTKLYALGWRPDRRDAEGYVVWTQL